jgi:hypothetical protein
MGQKKVVALIALLPLILWLPLVFLGRPVIQVLGVRAFETLVVSDLVLFFALTIYWSDQIRRNGTLSRFEKRVWWAILWLGSIVGLPVYFFCRAWPDAQVADE